jgi:hypothetical protein
MSEIEEIRQRYERGELDHIRRDLQAFVRNRRNDILKFKEEFNTKNPQTPLSDECAIKFFILKTRSINPQSEIREQLEEIEREKWIQGVRFGKPPDPNKVALEWARFHSPGWRSHRVTTIVYVFEREKDQYVLLLNGITTPHA